MKIDDAYSQWAPNYDADRNLTRDLDHVVTGSFLGGRRFALTIEAGCGTGKNTAQFAAASERVFSLDFSQGMLEQARLCVVDERVRFVHADLTRTWPCADGCAQLVAFNLVLEHIEHLTPIFREASRVLAPAGTVLVNEFHPFRQYQGGKARFVDAQATTVQIDAFTHHVSEFLLAARDAELVLESLSEHWHAEDVGKPPRLISIVLTKNSSIAPR